MRTVDNKISIAQLVLSSPSFDRIADYRQIIHTNVVLTINIACRARKIIFNKVAQARVSTSDIGYKNVERILKYRLTVQL